ncbi:MAG: flagellar basal body P-ring protein FlgI [bacterium]|nr:flagellar basal body P-ring protein FlgI [bacterium]
MRHTPRPAAQARGGAPWLLLALVAWLLAAPQAASVRLKEIASFQGSGHSDLIGYGLVVGLDGTGDGNRSAFTLRSVENMLRRFGIRLDPGTIKPKNVAAVMVTARLGAFARAGDRLDVTVSSLGDASSLMGGVLLMTPLTNQGGEEVLVRAQGPVSIGGFNFSSGGSSIRQNYTLVGRVPEGGMVERDMRSNLLMEGSLVLSLQHPDFTTAMRAARALNAALGEPLAQAIDAAQIRIEVPVESRQGNRLVELASLIENLDIEPDLTAKVVINERTGTVVVGRQVRLLPVAVAHGNLSVIIKSQQGSTLDPYTGFVGGQRQDEITVASEEAHLIVLDDMADVSGVARALNTLGVSPRDIISIFQLLKEAGALQAELVII